MAGRRRVQRSVRVTVAAVLVSAAAAAVAAAIAFSTAVAGAAVLAVVGGGAAARILYCEVVQTRRDASRSRADQALAFATTLSGVRAERAAEVAGWRLTVLERDRRIGDLAARVRRADERADDASARAEREAQRADDAQRRLTDVLDAVLAGPSRDVGPAQADDGRDASRWHEREPSTVVDLLAWEERTSSSRNDRARRRA
jgi:hypothetical protein